MSGLIIITIIFRIIFGESFPGGMAVIQVSVRKRGSGDKILSSEIYSLTEYQ